MDPAAPVVTVLYFASVKERMGLGEERLPLPAGVATVAALQLFLAARDERGARAFAQASLIRAAVNQDFAAADAPVRAGDEVAFFPPVTGG